MQPSLLPNVAEREPPLKWAGGKRWLVPRLRELYEPHRHRRFVAPFCGGLGDVLGVWPRRALLNDANPQLINFYRWWAMDCIDPTHDLFQDNETVYYQNRQRFVELCQWAETGTQEAAELFYYLNRTGFNGLCRYNAQGGFNVPYGRKGKKGEDAKPRDYVTPLGLDGRRLPYGWSFTCGDFSALCVYSYSFCNIPADFIYADPPYDGTFADYVGGGFDWDQQVALVNWLAEHRGPVVLSNAATDRIIELYTAYGYTVDLVDAPRRIACNGDRAKAKEVLATKNMGEGDG